MKNRAPIRKPLPKKQPSNVYRRKSPGLSNTHSSSFRSTDNVVCAIKGQCGACKYVNEPYEAGLNDKYQRGLGILKDSGITENCRMTAPVKSPRTLEYRSLFKLAVRPVAANEPAVITYPSGFEVPNRFNIGLFHPGTHDVVSMDNCPLHTYPLKRLLRELKTELNLSSLTPYNEETGEGDVRYLAARAAHLTGEIILTFVVTSAAKKGELRKVSEALQRRDHRITSTYMNIHTERNNAIFGDDTQRIGGTDRLRERVCDLDFEVGPTSFFQINPWQAINLYRRVEHFAGPASGAEVAWDLFCGTGQMTLILAKAGYRVLGIEENPAAVADAEANARKNKLSEWTTFVSARVEDSTAFIPAHLSMPSLIVVNPSRRGLAASTREYLANLMKLNPRCRLLYVSCEVETLARDLKDLVTPGFKLRQLEAFDMFPQTTNMEWLALVAP